MTTAVAFLLLIGVLIFIHELGHFIVAKAFDIKVTKFSLGFGPKLLGKKWGETEYVIAVLPLGGYVKMHGENPLENIPDAEKKRSFSHQMVWKRALVVAAGPFFNFALAAVIFAGVYLMGVTVPTAEIGGIAAGYAAQTAGLRPGDVIVSINDQKVEAWDDVVATISSADGSPMRIAISRTGENGRLMIKTITPTKEKTRNIFGEEVFAPRLGVAPTNKTTVKRFSPPVAVARGIEKVGDVVGLTLTGVVKMFQGVISPAESLGGPLAIAQMAGTQARAGALPFLLLLAFLSVNLGIINLFPLPALDGGHLLFYLIEAVTRKPPSPKVLAMTQKIGFILLVALMVFVLFIDINRANFGLVNDFSRMFSK